MNHLPVLHFSESWSTAARKQSRRWSDTKEVMEAASAAIFDTKSV